MLCDSTSSPSQTAISVQPIFASMTTSWLPTEPAPMTVTGFAAEGLNTSSCWEELSVCMGLLLFLGARFGRRVLREAGDGLLHGADERGRDGMQADARVGVGLGQRLVREPAGLVMVGRLVDVRPLLDLHRRERVRVALGEPAQHVADRVRVALFAAGLGDRVGGVPEARAALLRDVRMRDAVLVGRRLAPDRDDAALAHADDERAERVPLAAV